MGCRWWCWLEYEGSTPCAKIWGRGRVWVNLQTAGAHGKNVKGGLNVKGSEYPWQRSEWLGLDDLVGGLKDQKHDAHEGVTCPEGEMELKVEPRNNDIQEYHTRMRVDIIEA